MVSIGPPERGREFCELTGFASESFYADEQGALYEALALNKGARETFFSPSTPFAFAEWLGRENALAETLAAWKPWLPPKQGQAFQQGGSFVFAPGCACVFEHYDASTGAHASPQELLEALTHSSLL